MYPYFCAEDIIHKSFKLLPASFTAKLMETFTSQFWNKGKVTGPIKACELGTEVSWLPLTCVLKGVLYEGYMKNPELSANIQADLLQSKGC